MKIYDILDEREQQEVQKLIDNEVLLQALEKVFVYPIYTSGTLKKGKPADPQLNFALSIDEDSSNEEVGAKLRARVEGLRFFLTGLENLKSFRKVEVVKKDKINEAR